jgi:bifunctional DNA-binding transcriptional regulator/antitoxin component of YhaV-PrlF toxin-antitoxin module
MEYTSKITIAATGQDSGRATIPKPIMAILKLKIGDALSWQVTGDIDDPILIVSKKEVGD